MYRVRHPQVAARPAKFRENIEYPFTEAHLLRDELHILSFDYCGNSAREYVIDASEHIGVVGGP